MMSIVPLQSECFLKRNHTSPASSASDEGFAVIIWVAGSMHVAIGG